MRVFLPTLASVDKNAARELALKQDLAYDETKFENNWSEFMAQKKTRVSAVTLTSDVQAERDRCVKLVEETLGYLNGLIERSAATDKPGLLRTRVMFIGLADGIISGAAEREPFLIDRLAFSKAYVNG